MDVYKDGFIYVNHRYLPGNKNMADNKYPCPQPHPFKDGEDVTGKYGLEYQVKMKDGKFSSVYNKYDYYCTSEDNRRIIAIPTEQPTVKGVDINGDEYPRLPLDALTEHPSGIVFGKVERLNPDGSKTLISDGYSEQPKEQSDGWVRVEDRLPDDPQEVNIYFKNDVGWHVVGSYWNGYNFIELCERCGYKEPFPHTCPITHWQPLPPPPKH